MKKKLQTYLMTGVMVGGLSAITSAQNTPCTALPIAVNPSCSNTTADNSSATPSGVPAPGCGSYGSGNDIWYEMTVPASGNFTITTAAGSITDAVMAIYNGSCASPTFIACNDDTNGLMPEITNTSLTPGSTVYIQLFEYGSNATGTFDICVVDNNPGGGGGGAPANDDCANAIPLTVNADGNCTAQTSGTIENSTGSPDPTSETCGGTADDDVWYSFVATQTTHELALNNVAGSTTDLYHSVYEEGAGCPGLGTEIVCSDPNTSTLNGLTPGLTYYVRVYSWTSTAGQNSTFDICITSPTLAPPPANDDCATATPITVNPDGNCTAQTSGTINGATGSTDPASGTCSGTADDDVWYSFVATSTEHLISLNNVAGSTTDLYHSVYEAGAGCPTLGAEIICSDPNNSSLTGLTIGTTYYVRVYSWTSTALQTTTFDICVTTPEPPPANVNCGSMEPICTDNSLTFTGQSGGADASTVDPGNDYGCLSKSPNPTWFFFEIDNPGDITFDMSSGSDIDFALWGPYADLAAAQAACGGLPAPIDCSYSTSATETADITGAQTGEVYVLLITNYANVTQVIIADQTGGVGSTDCTIVNPPACAAEAGSW